MNIKTPIGRLRLLALLEGISLLLFAITMPMKYGLQIPEPNFYLGMAHGWLFILYVVLAIQNTLIYRWGFWVAVLVLGASFIPFGTFYADHKILKPAQVQ